jgi:hypothetical protein
MKGRDQWSVVSKTDTGLITNHWPLITALLILALFRDILLESALAVAKS